MATSDSYDLLFKVILAGNSGVGKSNLFSRFYKNEFSLESGATLGVEFGTKTMILENTTLKAQIWDTCGQEQFRSLTKNYYKKAHGALIVYDITKRQTFDDVQKWYDDIKEYGEEDIAIMLIGNKSDLRHLREVESDRAAEYAKSKNMVFLETSALDSTNVELAFQYVVKEIFSIYQSHKTTVSPNNRAIGEGEVINIDSTSNKDKNDKKRRFPNCCNN